MLEGPPVRAVLLDVEGTLVDRGVVVPGAPQAVRALVGAGVAVAVLTNVDSRPGDDVHAELAAAGFDLDRAHVRTAADVALAYLADRAPTTCLPLMREELARAFRAYAVPPGEHAAHVLVGDTRHMLTYDALNAAFRALRAGADLLVLQGGRWFLEPDGPSIDTGSIAAALAHASGSTPVVLGKPSVEAYGSALAALGVDAGAAVMVGDDARSDVAGAQAVGLRGVLVRTGKFRPGDEAAAERPPDAVLGSVADLPALLGVDG